MNSRQTKPGVTDFLLAGITALFFIGILTFLSPCGPMEDGSWMTCHWAGQAVRGLAAVMLAAALMHLFFSDAGIKKGISLSLIPMSVLAAVLPGGLIHLCMMDTMRCHTVMRTGVLLFAALIIAAAIADLIRLRRA